jgi:metal-responsive CopG/Arc/MetJ family transcriptional regulator
MGRPFSDRLRSDWKLSIDASLAAEVDLRLEDPVTRKPKYGARSQLVQLLLRDYLNRLDGKERAPLPSIQQIVAAEVGP